MECRDCERDMRGGVHDADCKDARHLDEGMVPACDPFGDVISLDANRTTEREIVNCVDCRRLIGEHEVLR